MCNSSRSYILGSYPLSLEGAAKYISALMRVDNHSYSELLPYNSVVIFETTEPSTVLNRCIPLFHSDTMHIFPIHIVNFVAAGCPNYLG
jgi:hypothetical protein